MRWPPFALRDRDTLARGAASKLAARRAQARQHHPTPPPTGEPNGPACAMGGQDQVAAPAQPTPPPACSRAGPTGSEPRQRSRCRLTAGRGRCGDVQIARHLAAFVPTAVGTYVLPGVGMVQEVVGVLSISSALAAATPRRSASPASRCRSVPIPEVPQHPGVRAFPPRRAAGSRRGPDRGDRPLPVGSATRCGSRRARRSSCPATAENGGVRADRRPGYAMDKYAKIGELAFVCSCQAKNRGAEKIGYGATRPAPRLVSRGMTASINADRHRGGRGAASTCCAMGQAPRCSPRALACRAAKVFCAEPRSSGQRHPGRRGSRCRDAPARR